MKHLVIMLFIFASIPSFACDTVNTEAFDKVFIKNMIELQLKGYYSRTSKVTNLKSKIKDYISVDSGEDVGSCSATRTHTLDLAVSYTRDFDDFSMECEGVALATYIEPSFFKVPHSYSFNFESINCK